MRIFLSSTHRDLATERLLIQEVLERLRIETEGFGYFAPRSGATLEFSLKELGLSDLTIFLIGHCYGGMAPGKNLSQAELEFEEALKLDKPKMVFLLSNQGPLLLGLMERDPVRQDLLKKFRARLQSFPEAIEYIDPPQLAQKVRLELENRLKKAGLVRIPSKLPLRSHTRSPNFPNTANQGPSLVFGTSKQSIDSGESPTRTLPTLQKALATPFSGQRRPGSKSGMSILITLMVIAGFIGLGWWAFHQIKRSAKASPDTAATQIKDSVVHSDTSIPNAVAIPLPPTSTIELQRDTTLDFVERAKGGDMVSQRELGRRYAKGEGLKRNLTDALTWYRQAAKQGDPESQYQMGMFYLEGKTIRLSTSQAFNFLKLAADKGHAQARGRLGTLLIKGTKAIAPDPKAGFKYLLQASEQGDSLAKVTLEAIKTR